MSEPAKSPPPPGKKSRMVFWLGCAGCGFFLLLIGIAGTMTWMFMRSQGGRERAHRPEGWLDSIRVASRLPAAVAQLAPEPAAEAPLIPDPRDLSPPVDTSRRGRALVLMRLGRGEPLAPGDDAIIAAARTDPALDPWEPVAAARGYDILPRLAPGPRGPFLLPPLGPGVPFGAMPVTRGAAGLLLRGEAWLRRGDTRRARASFSAAMALGRMVRRSEATFLDMQAGRRIITDAAEAFQRLAARTGDSGLARQAGEVLAWSRHGIRFGYEDLPDDSILVIAADTAFPRGSRVEAITAVTLHALFRPPPRIFLGPPTKIIRAVRALESDPDPAVARVALASDSTLARLKSFGPLGRLRLLTRPR